MPKASDGLSCVDHEGKRRAASFSNTTCTVCGSCIFCKPPLHDCWLLHLKVRALLLQHRLPLPICCSLAPPLLFVSLTSHTRTTFTAHAPRTHPGFVVVVVAPATSKAFPPPSYYVTPPSLFLPTFPAPLFLFLPIAPSPLPSPLFPPTPYLLLSCKKGEWYADPDYPHRDAAVKAMRQNKVLKQKQQCPAPSNAPPPTRELRIKPSNEYNDEKATADEALVYDAREIAEPCL